jgi:hypothetical protein
MLIKEMKRLGAQLKRAGILHSEPANDAGFPVGMTAWRKAGGRVRVIAQKTRDCEAVHVPQVGRGREICIGLIGYRNRGSRGGQRGERGGGRSSPDGVIAREANGDFAGIETVRQLDLPQGERGLGKTS